MPNVPRSSGRVVNSTGADSNVRPVRFGIALANVGTYSDPRAAIRVAEAAETSGWDGVFLWDHLGFVWGPPAADPWVTLAGIATATSRVRIGTMVTPVARRRPHVLANQVATLDVLSGGRVVFGAGLGGTASEFGKFGEPTEARVRAAMLDEGLELLRRFWSGEEVTHRGEHYVVEGVKLAPTPVQERLPIWIGGNKPASRRRAARWNGWVPDSVYPPDAGASPQDVAAGLTGAPSDFDVAVIGETGPGDPRAYEEAGATWWLESIHDRRGSTAETMNLVEAGPPS
jgi:alkanesulfonate monooxygenase SsuD/methylene tetrahydromethanopterin reductase-like flavin-dependent oxidoreductase (luciferase family)